MMTTRELPAIAVVDDDPSVLRALARLVRTSGYAITCYRSAAEFLDNPDAGAVGCLIADVQMPGMNGFALHAALEEKGRCPATIYITAHDSPWAREQAAECHAVGFLVKPFRSRNLLAMLDALLRTHERGDVPTPRVDS